MASKEKTDTVSPLTTGRSQLIAWHGWRLNVPDAWNPVKVDGDRDQGVLLLADMFQAKLGLRWRRMKRGDPVQWANRSLEAEVGKLAAAEAVDYPMPEGSDWRVSKLYIDKEPPGRDIWVGWSQKSGRVLEIVHHAKTRDPVLADQVLPSVSDTQSTDPQAWSIYDFSAITSAEWSLKWFRLNAGDLTLAFANQRRSIRLRQVGPASLALSRMELDDWIGQLDKAYRKIYREAQNLSDVTLQLPTRALKGRSGVFRRKRRLFWAFRFANEVRTLGFHDPVRNRLLMAQGDDEPAMREMIATMGWASREVEK